MINTALFHYSVCSVSRFYLAVYRNISVRNRAVPNIMVALAVPNEITAVFFQNFADYFFILSHLSDLVFSLGMIREFNILVFDAVQFHKLRNREFNFFYKSIKRTGFENEARNIVACCYPYAGIIIPKKIYFVFHEKTLLFEILISIL